MTREEAAPSVPRAGQGEAVAPEPLLLGGGWRRRRLAGGRVRQRPDLGLGRRQRHAAVGGLHLGLEAEAVAQDVVHVVAQ